MGKCEYGRCYSPLACDSFGYCRAKNMDRLWIIRGYSPKSKRACQITVQAHDYQSAKRRAKGFVVTDVVLQEGK
jgi:hypothetical protein